MPNETEKTGKIRSPEQLNNYIRVTQPGAWIILAAILVFFAGFFFWILNGELEISFSSFAYTQGEKSSAFVTPDKAVNLKAGTPVRISELGLTGKVQNVNKKMIAYNEISELIGETNALAMNINNNDKLIKIDLEIKDAPQNVSPVVFIMASVKPLSFFLK